MENFKDFIGRRHSYRKWTDQPVTEEELKTVLRAGLITPADKGPITELEFIVIDDKEKLDKLSNIKAVAGKMIGQAPVAIAVIAKHDHFDWIEEASAATMDYAPAGARLRTGKRMECHARASVKRRRRFRTTGS